jgi:RNA polymerase sigma-70 factor, ECF subfamily
MPFSDREVAHCAVPKDRLPVTSTGNPRASSDSERTAEFLRLLGVHEERINALVFSLVPNWADAQDIAQDVRLRLWEQFDAYDRTKDFGAWARVIAYYQVLAYRKRLRGRHLHFGDEFLQLVAATFDAGIDQFEARSRAMQKCISKLSAVKRRLLLRCYSGRETVRQVADSLGRSFEALRKSVLRTRRQLAACIQRELKSQDEP